MSHSVLSRPIQQYDFPAWKPLWDGYNAFYGRSEATTLPPKVTEATWQSFLDPAEPVFALVAETQGRFTSPPERRGIGRALIEGVYEQGRCAGLTSVYWQTHVSNTAGRLLYDKVATHLGFIV